MVEHSPKILASEEEATTIQVEGEGGVGMEWGKGVWQGNDKKEVRRDKTLALTQRILGRKQKQPLGETVPFVLFLA